MDTKDVPMYYADQPAGLMVGAHVSRLTFGVQEDDDSNYPRPVVTVAIPTNVLIELVSDLRIILSDDSFKKNTAQQLEGSIKRVMLGIRDEATPQLEGPSEAPAKARKSLAAPKKVARKGSSKKA